MSKRRELLEAVEARGELHDAIIDLIPQEFRQDSKGAVDCVRRVVAALAAERAKTELEHAARLAVVDKLAAEREKTRLANIDATNLLAENTQLQDALEEKQ